MLRGSIVLFLAVAARDLLAALARKDLFCNGDDFVRVDVADDAQRHVGRTVERTVAVVERLRGDARDALDRTSDGHARGRGAVQAGKKPLIDLPVGRILDHADLLSDDAALLSTLSSVKYGTETKESRMRRFSSKCSVQSK